VFFSLPPKPAVLNGAENMIVGRAQIVIKFKNGNAPGSAALLTLRSNKKVVGLLGGRW
jgi:hypothetical protein